jgi:hypothetical protein
MRVKTRELTGHAEIWDGTNLPAIMALAGDAFEGTYAPNVMIRTRDGEICHVRPGWAVSAWDGVDGVGVHSAGAFTANIEEIPGPAVP